ncbi:MAG: glycosyltransferase [Candidatus Andersenbacteria bacterium]|nr:glycosyltransferase [Candidatus Andersenbacteria bacterium]
MPQGLRRPFFSVGVTAFRRRDLLRETLASLQAQIFSDFEVLVGNDDPAEELAAEAFGISDARIRFINHPRNLGEIGNMNALLAASQARYFTWLADDDCFQPGFLARVREAIARHGFPPAVVTNYGAGQYYQAQAPAAVAERVFSGRAFLDEFLCQRVRAIGSSAVLAREVLRRWGGASRLGTGTPLYTDTLLAIKLGRLERVVYLEAPLIFLRTHARSQSWISTDAAGYQSAQEALCQESIAVFRTEHLRGRFDWYLFQLLRVWCVSYYYKVLRRSSLSALAALPGYWRFIWRTSQHMSRFRLRLLAALVRQTWWLAVSCLHRLVPAAGQKAGV